jgi:hypothetical protein
VGLCCVKLSLFLHSNGSSLAARCHLLADIFFSNMASVAVLPAVAPSSAIESAVSPADEELAVQAEVTVQLKAVMATLPPFRQMLLQEQLDIQPSRLHARLCEYVRQVAAVDAHVLAGKLSEVSISGDEAGASSAAMSASAPVAAVPVLSHQTFAAALESALLHLLEERWESVFAASGGNVGCTCNDGKRISKAERARKGLSKSALVYGEVAFSTLGEVLWSPLCARIPERGACFIDLGSGTGRGVLAAASLHSFGRLVGVEILEGLHHAALDVASHYETSVRPTFKPTDPRAHAKIELICGSFLDVDWPSYANVVFANSTCFDDDLMASIESQGQGLKDGSLIITLTRPLTGPYYKLVYCEAHKMSWGEATINIMIKRTPEPAEIAAALALAQAVKAKQRQRYALD